MDVRISVDELSELLADSKPVTVVDIRAGPERKDWWIPGSIHVDAYEAFKAGHPGPLAAVKLPAAVPVVTVCGVGKTSALATAYLRGQGIEAFTLAGGMRSWSLAWNTAVVERAGLAARVVQIRRTGKGCLSYLIASEGDAVVIDPSVDPHIYVREAVERRWRITQVLETHLHADHLSRARRLADLTNAKLLLPALDRVRFSYAALHEGDVVELGSTRLAVWHTPGHTPESICFLTDGAVFTGDTLLAISVGRPDLGTAAGGSHAHVSQLYCSVKRLLTLPASTLVFPGHWSEPIAFDRVPVGTDIAAVSRRLASLVRDETGFVAGVLARLPEPPPNHSRITALNEHGILPEGEETELEAGANRCAVA